MVTMKCNCGKTAKTFKKLKAEDFAHGWIAECCELVKEREPANPPKEEEIKAQEIQGSPEEEKEENQRLPEAPKKKKKGKKKKEAQESTEETQSSEA